MGISNLEIQNISLLLRWWWRLYQQEESLWKMWASRLRGGVGVQEGLGVWLRQRSFFWNQLLKLQPVFRWSTSWSIGDGCSILYWYENWKDGPIRQHGDGLPRPQFPNISLAAALTLSPPMESDIVDLPYLTAQLDTLIWNWGNNGTYTSKSIYQVMMSGGKIKWAFDNWWAAKCPSTVRLFFYLLLRGRTLTQDVLLRRHIHVQIGCVMCQVPAVETSLHLFFVCPYAKQVWNLTSAQLGLQMVVNGSSVKQITQASWA